MTPAERWYVAKAVSGNEWYWRQSWLCPQTPTSWTERNQRHASVVLATSSCHKPSQNPKKSEECATQQQSTKLLPSLNDKLLYGPDLLQSLIGIFFRFRELQIAISADIEAMILQVAEVAVPSDDNRCLRFLWREDPELKKNVYEYTRHRRARRLVQITLCIKWRKIKR